MCYFPFPSQARVCNTYINASIWKQRVFVHADGTPVVHGQAVVELIQAMQLPQKLAIVKCAARQNNKTLVAMGNN